LEALTLTVEDSMRLRNIENIQKSAVFDIKLKHLTSEVIEMIVLKRTIQNVGYSIMLMLFSSPLLATTILDQIGYADGYGKGIELGEAFEVSILSEHVNPGPITNVKLSDDTTFSSFTYTPIETSDIEFAALEIVFAGTESGVSLFHGNLPIKPFGATINNIGYGISTKLTIILTPGLYDILDGSTDFSFIDLYGQTKPWAIDYARLIISDEVPRVIPDAISEPVPEPSSLAILCLGIAGLTVIRRKKLMNSV